MSLGVALAKNPSLVFLDEPTSGLDSAAAASIVSFLKEVSAVWVVAYCTVVVSISTHMAAAIHVPMRVNGD